MRAQRIWNEELNSHVENGDSPQRSRVPQSVSRAGGRGVSSVRIGPGKVLDILSNDINTKYGTTSRDILSLRFKTCSQFNTRLSGQNRKSSRGVHANGHAGDTRAPALGPSVIEPSSKRKIPVTRNDGDESMLWSGPAVLGSEAVSTWSSHYSMPPRRPYAFPIVVLAL